MGIFRNRPLAFACIAAAMAALIASRSGAVFRLTLLSVLFAIGCVLLAVALIRRRCGAMQTTAILSFLLASVLLFGSWSFFDLQMGATKKRAGETVAAEGIVTERLNTGATQCLFAMDLTEFDGVATRRRVLLSCEYLSALRTGERVRLTATVASGLTDGDAHSEADRIADGFAGRLICVDADDCTVISGGGRSFKIRLTEWNHALSERLAASIGGAEGGLAAALALGNRSLLERGDALAFRRAGISHLLALSGLHVGVLVTALDRFLRLLRVPRVARVFPVMGLSVAYLALTGGAPSTVRAVLMAVMLSLALLIRRTYDSFTAIAAALFLILAVQPYAVADVGLWLSFCAAGSIVIFLPAVRALFRRHGRSPHGIRRLMERFGKAVALAAAVGIFAFCATLPLTAAFFGETSVLSVPVTLILSPLVTVGLVLSMTAVFLPFPPLAALTARILGAIRQIALFVSDRRGVMILLQDRRTWILIAVLSVSLVICAVVPLRRRALLGVPVLAAVAVILSAYAAVPSVNQGVDVTYANHGSNEYILLAGGGKAVAVDLSDGSRNDAGRLTEELHRCGCTELEELVLTHYHSASTYLLDRLTARVKIRILRLPIPLNDREVALAGRIEEEAGRLGLRIVYADEGVSARQISIRAAHDPTESDPAVTLEVQTCGQTVVWVNPKERSAVQSVFLTDAMTRADVVIVGLHGTRSHAVCRLPEGTAERVILGGSAERLTVEGIPPGAETTVAAEITRWTLKKP